MADTGNAFVEITNGVARVTFSHPKSNALPGQLLTDLASEFDALAKTDDVRVIILQSEGSATFCAGASFDEFRAITTAAQGKEFFSGFARLILAMIRCPQFVLGRVHGKAAGGGIGIIAACDYSFAVETVSVRLSELAVGIGPFIVGPVIERRVGPGALAAMAIDTEWRDAAWCERHGLFSRVFDTPHAMDAVLTAMANRLAASNPDAMSRMKKTFWSGTDHWETLLFERASLSGELVLSEYTKRAIEAFSARA
ncbi:MAG TPA: enoyl-CoA hydratase/isomerase family protein [Gemmatimonadaceae bacterium]|nr:enoyl-CoA hydratase/isomerase family protein [Gemmatimonadaceae bacterium]